MDTGSGSDMTGRGSEVTAPQTPAFPVTGVRVGIVVWNTADLLDSCLSALPAALSGLDAEVVVVDNNSSDHSADVADRHDGVRVIRNSDNLGYARAMNQALCSDGAGVKTPEVLVALNPDTVPPRDSLSLLVERLLAQPDVGLVVPRLANTDGSSQHSVYRFPSVAVSAAASLVPIRWQQGRIGRRFCLEGQTVQDQAGDIDWAIGAVHVIRLAALHGQPPYNERWFMYVEDLDLCWRLAQAGWRRISDPSVTVAHVGNAAGSQAWGDERTGRWLDATYDWYQLRHGDFATRCWAVANTGGVLVRLVPASVRWAARRPVQGWERDLSRVLPHHLRALAGR